MAQNTVSLRDEMYGRGMELAFMANDMYDRRQRAYERFEELQGDYDTPPSDVTAEEVNEYLLDALHCQNAFAAYQNAASALLNRFIQGD